MKEYRFYIFCEGEQTEPRYFGGFKKLIEDNPIYRDMALIQNEPCGVETMRMIGQAEQYVKDNQIHHGSKVVLPIDKYDTPSFCQFILFLYSFPQFSMDFMIGRMDSPSSLNAYSTRGGTSRYTVRVMMPSASMERKLSVSTF